MHEPGANQESRAGGQPGGQRRHGEDRQASEQHAATPEQVAEAASEQEEASVGEDVATGHPLQVLLREAQAVLDGWQGDVDDR